MMTQAVVALATSQGSMIRWMVYGVPTYGPRPYGHGPGQLTVAVTCEASWAAPTDMAIGPITTTDGVVTWEAASRLLHLYLSNQ